MTACTRAKSARPLAAALATVALALAAPSARAQVCGDVSGDDQITASDAQRVLKAAVGQDVELVCNDQCAALEARVAALEALLASVTVQGDNFVLTGVNLQVVSGSGETDGQTNGTGNIIVGYNEADGGDDRNGSHNLVIGGKHSYSSWGGIVAGEDNEIAGDQASVLGGTLNLADGDRSVVVGGRLNQAQAVTTVVVAGEGNRASARSCSVAAGTDNLCTGISSAVSGGIDNACSGNSATIGGGGQTILNSNSAWVAGSLTPTF